MATQTPLGGSAIDAGLSKPKEMSPDSRAALPKRESVKLFFQVWPAVTGSTSRRAISGLKWTIVIGEGRNAFVQKGVTNSVGAVEFKMAKTEIANMNILGTDYELTYQDVESDPATVEGARQRLGKLGYLPVKDEAYFNKPEIDFAMDHFMLCFQADHGLEIHGEIEREATEGLREGIHLSVESTRYRGAKFSDSFAAKIQAEAGG